MKVIMTIGVLIFLVIGLYFFSDWFSKTTGYVLGSDQKIKLAQCLSEKGITLYNGRDCLDCYNQIDEFGEEAYSFLSVVDCSASEGSCSSLKEVPAWQIGNGFQYGMKSLQELIDISGCEVQE